MSKIQKGEEIIKLANSNPNHRIIVYENALEGKYVVPSDAVVFSVEEWKGIRYDLIELIAIRAKLTNYTLIPNEQWAEVTEYVEKTLKNEKENIKRCNFYEPSYFKICGKIEVYEELKKLLGKENSEKIVRE